MLRLKILPSSSPAFGRFSSSSSCFALPLLQQNFSFASAKSKAVANKTQKKRGKNEKINVDAMDLEELRSQAKVRFSNTFQDPLEKEMRAMKSWKLSKTVARQMHNMTDASFILRAVSVFLSLPYAASTKMNDFFIIARLCPSDFTAINRILFERIVTSLEKDRLAEAPQKDEATPISVSQVKKLIGDTKLLTSLDRTLFQCFVLGCKVSDLYRQQRVLLPKHNIVLIRQQRRNSRTSASFLRFVPSTKEQFERVWKQSELKTSKESFYLKLRNHIQRKLKSSALTPGSIPEGAIKFLRDRGVPDEEITSITGDGSVPMSLNARCPASPQKTAPRQQTRNITKLIKAIFPDGKY